jgi:transcriptional regulator with XRE-family HTH domain
MNDFTKKRSVLEELMSFFHIGDNELSEKIGLPSTTIYKLKSGETGDPRYSTMKALANYFNITLGQLVGEEPLNKEFLGNNKLTFYFKVPILDWDQIPNCCDILSTINETTHFSWAYLKEAPEKKKNIFALTINTNEYASVFPINSVIFIEINTEKYDNYYALVCELSSKKCGIFKVIDNIETYFIHPEKPTISFPYVEHRHKLIGKILGVNIRYENCKSYSYHTFI